MPLHLSVSKTAYFLEDCEYKYDKRCMGHPYEHLQKGKEGEEGTIIDFEEIIRTSSNGENKKSLRLLFMNISSCQLDEI